jgi:Family of unknown function (DUF6502)
MRRVGTRSGMRETARPRISAEALLSAVRPVLRPVVRLMIACGATFPAAADLLRRLFVEVAQAGLPPEEQTDSRVSVLTGVHRKELRRLREEGPAESEAPPPSLTLASQIIARWLGAPPFADQRRRPRALPRLGQDGPSFETLVQSVTRDVRPRTILDELQAQGLVTVDTRDRVHLQAAAYLPAPGRDEQLFYFGRNLRDHAAAAAANVAATGKAPFFDRSLHYDRLTPEAADALEAAARKAAEALLLDLNRLAIRLVEEGGEAPDGAPGARVNVGVFVFKENEAEDEAS